MTDEEKMIWEEKERYYLERISALENQVKMLDRRNEIDMMLMESQVEIYAEEIARLEKELENHVE